MKCKNMEDTLSDALADKTKADEKFQNQNRKYIHHIKNQNLQKKVLRDMTA